MTNNNSQLDGRLPITLECAQKERDVMNILI